MIKSHVIIAVDFDGTIVEHDYPNIGHPVPGAVEALVHFVARGALVILWTVRDGKELEEAVRYVNDRGVQLYGVNNNPGFCSESPKVYADVYIDDLAMGCPMRMRPGAKSFVDWTLVRPRIDDMITQRRAWAEKKLKGDSRGRR